MARLQSKTFGDRLGKYFYPLAIAGVLLTLGGVVLYLPTRFAIFGLYALFGLVGGAVVYYRTDEFDESFRNHVDERLYGFGVYIATAVTLGVVALTGEPLFVAVGLLIGYTLFVYQFVAQPTPERLLPQLTALFLLSPAVKYLTAGQYIGQGDLLKHVRWADDIIRESTIGAIAGATYYDVPGLHVIVATVSSLSGLDPYDGLMLTGLVAFSIVIPAVYILTLRVTNEPMLALSTAVGIAFLNDLSFFVSYAFPQSIATIMVVILMVLGNMILDDSIKWQAGGLFVVVAFALAMTHHLTQILFLPVIACFILTYFVISSGSIRNLSVSQLFFLLVALLVNGVILWQIGFYTRLYNAAVLLIQGGLLGGYSQGTTIGLGMTPPSASTSMALKWLFSPYALYLVLLLSVFSIGAVTFIRDTEYSPAYVAVGCTGLVGALLILETPLSIKSLIRIGFPWQFAFAFIIGIGIFQLRRRIGSSKSSRLLIATLVILLTVTPLVAVDNYYGLDPRPTTETSFSETEFAELRMTQLWANDRPEQKTGFHETQLVMRRFHTSDFEHGTVRDGELILPAGQFIYRSGFPDNTLSFQVRSDSSLYSNEVHMSESWLSNRIERENHVYTAGGTGALWSPTERPLN